MTTKQHTAGRLKRIADTKPGDVIYLRPDHAQYKPEAFAIVIPSTARMAVEFVMLAGTWRIGSILDFERCVEVVGQQLASECVGLTRREIGEAAIMLRRGTEAFAADTRKLAGWVARAMLPDGPPQAGAYVTGMEDA